MVWINRVHSNEPPPKGSFGGSMCVCPKCEEERSYKVDAEIEKILPEFKSVKMMRVDSAPFEAIRIAKEALEEQVEALIQIGAIWSTDRANRFNRKVADLDKWLKEHC